MGSAFHQLCPRYSGTLTPTAPTAIRLWDTLTLTLTKDHLVRLESFIRDAFIKKEHCVAIFFYLEKAYDTTWKYGIMKDLHSIGLRGRLPNFISNFLSDRSFNVRISSALSDTFEQEQGVPQGSILSPTLFNIKINNIVKCVNDTDSSLYVDDFGIFFINRKIWRI